MPSRLNTKKLHESASFIGHFLQILQSKLLVQVTVGSHRGWYHHSAWALMHRISHALPSPTGRENVMHVLHSDCMLLIMLCHAFVHFLLLETPIVMYSNKNISEWYSEQWYFRKVSKKIFFFFFFLGGGGSLCALAWHLCAELCF